MREQLTEHLRQALDQAQREARAMNQEFVGTEHLLLGLLALPDPEALAGLILAGVEREALRKRLIDELPRPSTAPVVTGELPFSPNAQGVMKTALVKAQSMGAPRVSTRMLLVALLDECQTLVRPALRQVGADLDHLQRVLVQDGSIQPED
jgi:ATP-dependent Clp protease ATP-binding subunit ClpC